MDVLCGVSWWTTINQCFHFLFLVYSTTVFIPTLEINLNSLIALHIIILKTIWNIGQNEWVKKKYIKTRISWTIQKNQMFCMSINLIFILDWQNCDITFSKRFVFFSYFYIVIVILLHFFSFDFSHSFFDSYIWFFCHWYTTRIIHKTKQCNIFLIFLI